MYLADVGGLQLEQINSSRFEFVLGILGTNQFQRSRVAFAAEDLDEYVGVGAGSALFARLHRDVVGRRCKQQRCRMINISDHPGSNPAGAGEK